ncbi:hypothetical protein GCM10009847_00910 [Leucobacter tardus]|uniref:DUF7882 domain-containing protein n=1 Tax=Leucobacter tardus TaxID=501483 RepID=A0A939QHK4_9MICO|nr:hypothetical protein [Leucobacter tardus]MBO2991000.1 hypothetical protein [Leucobacter tardus]
MGVLIFNRQEYDFSDRLLAHLREAITGKLLRRESFSMSWVANMGFARHLTTLWVTPNAAMEFYFSHDREEEINPNWVDALEWSAYRDSGMEIMTEASAAKFVREHDLE